MEFVILALFVVLGYPFLASMIASRGMVRRIEALEEQTGSLREELASLRARVKAVAASAPAAAAEQTAPSTPASRAAARRTAPKSNTEPDPDTVLPPAPRAAAPTPTPTPMPTPLATEPIAAAPAPLPAPTSPEPASQQASPVQRTPPAWLLAAKNWLFTGNLVAKLGLLILFIGVGFLLKYASERVTVPIELRLAGIVLADIGLLAWGWRMRLTRRGLSLPIQGAALAILMLVTFGAFRMYQLIPSGLAFGLLFALTAFTCLLAVLQNAVWLAVFGIAGGFVSPIMTSTGQGSHVALFSYYSLLNAGVLAIALKRTWRALNLLGFAFTFVIGTAWGVLRYASGEDYLSTQLFLLLFFVYYVAIALVYAARQATQLKAYVDATIVFGTPLAAFGLQLGLMKNVAFGNAFSALGFGLFYTALALALWRRRAGHLKLLVESFLALGVVFGTLALPFALDGRWTSAAWALEGAGVVWVALRQKQRLAFAFGLLVQAGAWISFIGAVTGMDTQAARNSNLWLGFLILAATAFFMATTFRAHKEGEQHAFPRVASAFLALAAIWLMAGAWTEIALRHGGAPMANMLAASGLATAALLGLIAARMQWQRARTFSLAAQLLAGATLLTLVLTHWNWTIPSASLFEQPLMGALMICGAALFTGWTMWRAAEPGMTAPSRMLLAWAAFWWFGPILNGLSGWLMLTLMPVPMLSGWAMTWPSLYLICAAASGIACTTLARRLGWHDLRWLGISAWMALAGATVLLLMVLHAEQRLPTAIEWSGFAAAWGASECMLRYWKANGWAMPALSMRPIHLLRLAGPWLMLWKAGELWIAGWLAGAGHEQQLLADGGWQVSGSWANFLPAWAMMFAILWLVARSTHQRWPVAPLAAWYRQVVLPAAAGWSLLLAALWNLRQDGAMAPLPYLPLFNPLDLTTGFALVLGAVCYRMLMADSDALAPLLRKLAQRLPRAGAVAAYVWLNLILLRTAAHYLDLAYRADVLFASLFIQSMLSLVWSITALVLMRRAMQRAARGLWIVGAGFLLLVVAKLFLVDLSGTGSVARIVSFVGVGLLMVLIGYLAPYPNGSDAAPEPEPAGA